MIRLTSLKWMLAAMVASLLGTATESKAAFTLKLSDGVNNVLINNPATGVDLTLASIAPGLNFRGSVKVDFFESATESNLDLTVSQIFKKANVANKGTFTATLFRDFNLPQLTDVFTSEVSSSRNGSKQGGAPKLTATATYTDAIGPLTDTYGPIAVPFASNTSTPGVFGFAPFSLQNVIKLTGFTVGTQGTGASANLNSTIIGSTVPAPAGLILAGLGVAGFGFAKRRRLI